MARYMIIYQKSGLTQVTWKNRKEETSRLASSLRKAGYTVEVWENTINGPYKTNL